MKPIMNTKLRELIFLHEMFEPMNETGYQIDSIRSIKETWDFEKDEIVKEVNALVSEGLIEYFDNNTKSHFRATYKGKLEREKAWQTNGYRHKSLIEQTAPTKSLILALITAMHRYDGTYFYIESLPLYLWKKDKNEITNIIKELFACNLIRSPYDGLFNKGLVFLTVDGEIEYQKKIATELGIDESSNILEPKENNPKAGANNNVKVCKNCKAVLPDVALVNEFKCCPQCGYLLPQSITTIIDYFSMIQLSGELTTSRNLLLKSELESAVREAVITLETLVRKKSGLPDHIKGADLMANAFSFEIDKKNGVITKEPKIKINSLDDETKQNEQDGIKLMSMGLFRGVRNIYLHNSGAGNLCYVLEILSTTDFVLKHISDLPSVASFCD